jgi:hypothetical protein
MDSLTCGPLAAWANAWLAGEVAFDDVLVAASRVAPEFATASRVPSPRAVSSILPAADAAPVQVGELLIAWRQTGGPLRLILPVPGDVRGCPGPATFRAAALDAGQAVVGASVAAVPTVIDHRPSSAPPTLVWHQFEVDPVPSNGIGGIGRVDLIDYISVPDAQYELAEAIRECATTVAREVGRDLARAGLAGSGLLGADGLDGGDTDGGDVSAELATARRAGEHLNLPPGFAPRAVMLIAQAERLAAVLKIAGVDSSAAAGSIAELRTRSLAPLVTAVRRARVAGYNASW